MCACNIMRMPITLTISACMGFSLKTIQCRPNKLQVLVAHLFYTILPDIFYAVFHRFFSPIFFHRFFSSIFFTDFFHRYFSPIFFIIFFHQFFSQFFPQFFTVFPQFFTNFSTEFPQFCPPIVLPMSKPEAPTDSDYLSLSSFFSCT